MVASIPKPEERFDDDEVVLEMDRVIQVITAIRNIRGEMNVLPGEQIRVILKPATGGIGKRIQRNQTFIQNLAKVKELTIEEEFQKPSYSAFAQVQDVEIFVPMDRSRMEEEIKRLQKEILKIEKESSFVIKKLSNEQFISKAPPEIVQEVKDKALEFRTQREKLEESLNKIKEMIG